MFKRISLALAMGVVSVGLLAAQQTGKRPISLDDLGRLKDVRDPQCSPDGKSVAFVVSSTDVKEDKSNSHIWTISIDGQGERQLTSSQESESSPKFSPDGKYLSFTSSRPGKAQGQSGVAAGPERRRSLPAHRAERPAAGIRVVARFEAPRAGRRRSGS